MSQPVDLKNGDDVLVLLDEGSRHEIRSIHARIWPDAARAFLDINTRNRTITYSRVRTHVENIRGGRWKLVPDGLAVDWNGDLFNAQHRLLAIVEADTPCEMFIMLGLDPDARDVTDTGRSRSMADTLQMHGYGAGRTQAAAAIRLLYRWQHGLIVTVQTSVNQALPHDVLLRYTEQELDYELLNGCVNAAYTTAKAVPKLNISSYAALLYSVTQLNAAGAEAFNDSLRTGANLNERSPLLALRGALARLSTHRSNVWHLVAYVKTWNAWRVDRKVQMLHVKSEETVPELLS